MILFHQNWMANWLLRRPMSRMSTEIHKSPLKWLFSYILSAALTIYSSLSLSLPQCPTCMTYSLLLHCSLSLSFTHSFTNCYLTQLGLTNPLTTYHVFKLPPIWFTNFSPIYWMTSSSHHYSTYHLTKILQIFRCIYLLATLEHSTWSPLHHAKQ